MGKNIFYMVRCVAMKNKKIEELKRRDEAIWRKYNDGVDENDLEAVYWRGLFLGCYEQMVRILRRNCGNIPVGMKKTKLFELVLVTYVALYGKYIVATKFPEIADDVVTYGLSEYLEWEYEVIASLPAPLSEDDTEAWVRVMKGLIIINGVRNLALLDIMNSFIYTFTGIPGRLRVADEYKACWFDD